MVADCLSRMTNNVEVVPEEESLGSSLPCEVAFHVERGACGLCNRTKVQCDMCGNGFCKECFGGTDEKLPFVYCGKCVDMLDDKDPTTNLDLLRILVAEDLKEVVAELGVDRTLQLEKLAERYVVIGGVMYRVYRDGTKEVPSITKR